MADSKKKFQSRKRRQASVRKRLRGTESRPRLCVYRSLTATYAQLISDEKGEVLVAASSKETLAEGKSAKSVESAKSLGARVAELAKDKGIESIVFDRNGYLYHGRIAAVCEGAREAGLKV